MKKALIVLMLICFCSAGYAQDLDNTKKDQDLSFGNKGYILGTATEAKPPKPVEQLHFIKACQRFNEWLESFYFGK